MSSDDDKPDDIAAIPVGSSLLQSAVAKPSSGQVAIAAIINNEMPADNVVETAAPEHSDIDLAKRFGNVHANDWRYVKPWAKWYRWTGSVWVVDETDMIIAQAIKACCYAADSMARKKPGAAAQLTSRKTVAAIEWLARADQRIAATADLWDRDDWIINTPGGVVDLRTGQLRPHRREDFCTKITRATPRGDCPRWMEFLRRITGGDGERILYLQRMAGYALTGSTREHAVFFLYGTGANGKSVFINSLTHILGDYARTAPIEMFMQAYGERHPTELASLRGARLVTASETNEGRRWDEAKIKQLSAGDPVTARYMRQDDFTYAPRCKLVFAGNHRPGLRAVDEAVRRRFHLVPFDVTIPEEERDERLVEKLHAEADGIFKWMVEGAVMWGGEGLCPPEAVWKATADYLDSEDVLGQWLAAYCRVDAKAKTAAADLFASWKMFADKAGEQVGTQKRFSQLMQSRGFKAGRLAGGTRALCAVRLAREGDLLNQADTTD
jgi:putative DNA primase/helicase